MKLKRMKGGAEEEESQPVSPTGQYFSSSILSVSVLAVLEFDNPFDDYSTMALINNLFLPINPRFSSIMVEDEYVGKRWKQVEVKVEEHVKIPRFPDGLSPESYDGYFADYLSKIAMNPLPQTRPLWEIHIVKYPTSNAAGNVVFKLHHALGDGYSLMGALLSCLKRAENPNLPLTFPHFRKAPKESGSKIKRFIAGAPKGLMGVINTALDFGWSVLKSGFLEDDRTPIRSAREGVELRPIDITTMTFSLDQIKQIKAKLQVTINDVVTGVIFLGTRLYMEATSHESRDASSTALVLLNTRSIRGYKSVDEMVRNQEAETLWGNRFAFLHVSLTDLHQSDNSLKPLEFVYRTHNIIKRKRNSSAVYFNGRLLEFMRKFRGPEATSKYIHSTLKNSSMAVTSLIGPLEKMTLGNQSIKGLYFMVANVPQSLIVTMISYMNQFRVSVGSEKGHIDPVMLKTCIEKAWDMIFKEAVMLS